MHKRLYNPILDAIDEARAEAIAERKLIKLVLAIAAILWFWFLVVNVGVN